MGVRVERVSKGQSLGRVLDALRGALPPRDALLTVMALVLLRYEAEKAPADEWDEGARAREAWQALRSGGHWREGGRGLAEALHSGLRIREKGFPLRLDLPNLGSVRDREAELLINWVIAAEAPTELFDACLDQAHALGKAGDYFTPPDLIHLFISLMEPADDEAVYDPVCGSGGFLLKAREYAAAHGGRPGGPALYGQDASNTALLTAAMNFSVHGVDDEFLHGPANTLADDRFPDLTFDVVVANPPFNQSGWDEHGILRSSPSWPYGPPPAGNANFAWAQHVVRKMSPTGRGALLLPTGAASTAKGAESQIRAALVNDDVLSGVVELPAGLIPHVRNPVSLWLFSKSKRPHRSWGQSDRSGQFLLIDARDSAMNVKRGRRVVPGEARERIAATFAEWRGAPGRAPYEDVPGWCRSLSRDEIAETDYDVLPSHHVAAPPAQSDLPDAPERVADLTDELLGLFETSRRLEDELRDLLGQL
ncbi:N-6 DNA methylase [Streptomyces hirsutus]|uniref:N-6 DNA methylase n=1 Tax=Streptomyces hirsutus TaxID=35620 RepID=UPI00333265F8